MLLLLIVVTTACANPLIEDDFGNDEVLAREKRAMDTDYPIEEYLDNCGKTHRVVGTNVIKFISPFYGVRQYPAGVKCRWNFIGNAICTPQLSCTSLHLRKLDDDCTEEFLRISDGLGGQEKLCGKSSLETPIKASKGGRDLYVNLVISADENFPEKTDGVLCEVKCGNGKEVELKHNFERKEEFKCVCGLQNADDRIVGGEDAKMNEFPWQVAIVHAGLRTPKCGGSVINDRWILTAAHCWHFDKTKAKDIEVLIHARILDMTLKSNWADKALGQKGSIRGSGWDAKKTTDSDEGTQRYKVIEILNHPLFTVKYDYDVSLLKLDRKIDLTATNAPTPICLPPLNYSEGYEGQVPIVSGWGLSHQDAGGTTRILQKLPVPILNFQMCHKWMQYSLTPRMICAGYPEGGKDACMGDSGGPLQLKTKTKQWHQIGIVSWGQGCASAKRPGLYSRVTELLQWIQHHASDATWCRQNK